MLSLLVRRCAFLGGVIYLIFLFQSSDRYFPLYLLHVFVFIVYVYTISYWAQKKSRNIYTITKLTTTVFFISFIFVALNNVVSFIYTNNMFVFSEADARVYNYLSVSMANQSFGDGLAFGLSFLKFEDMGTPLVISTLYRLIESNLFVNFFYVITGLFAARALYRICTNFMSSKYAFICALSYSISSFVLWFHSSGLKESIMCFLLILFFDRYYLFIKTKRLSNIIYGSLFLSGLLLFRPVLILFAVAAIGMGALLQRRKGTTGVLVIFLVFITVVSSYSVLESSYDRFLMGGDLDRLFTAKEAMVKESLPFTLSVNLMSQLIGPMPTISPDIKEMLSFFAPGLIFKVLLSFLFWMGVYYIFKLRAEMLYPLIFFSLLEMASLLTILEGLELRKSLPHFFAVYIVAFWFLDKYDLTNFFKKKHSLKLLFNFSAIITFFILLAWNIRYQML